jgi:hypothetical protein
VRRTTNSPVNNRREVLNQAVEISIDPSTDHREYTALPKLEKCALARGAKISTALKRVIVTQFTSTPRHAVLSVRRCGPVRASRRTRLAKTPSGFSSGVIAPGASPTSARDHGREHPLFAATRLRGRLTASDVVKSTLHVSRYCLPSGVNDSGAGALVLGTTTFGAGFFGAAGGTAA